MSEVLSAECTNHLATAMQIAANAPPEAVGDRLVTWLKGLLGEAFVAIEAAVKSGAITPAAILAYLSANNITVPSWLPAVLEIVLPLILSALGA